MNLKKQKLVSNFQFFNFPELQVFTTFSIFQLSNNNTCSQVTVRNTNLPNVYFSKSIVFSFRSSNLSHFRILSISEFQYFNFQTFKLLGPNLLLGRTSFSVKHLLGAYCTTTGKTDFALRHNGFQFFSYFYLYVYYLCIYWYISIFLIYC